MTIIHHEELRGWVKPCYTLKEVRDLLAFLHARRVLSFTPFATGLYPAAGFDTVAAQSGYGSTWARDNIYVALAHEVAGQVAAAQTVVEALAAFYRKHRRRFVAIVDGSVNPKFPMNRPHVRFDGINLVEFPARWAQAQNDALGYFLWAYCRMACKGHLSPDSELLALFALYFERIRYWEDEDSGHWEERPKVEASSIGAVVAGLRALRELLAKNMGFVCQFEDSVLTTDVLDGLIEAGVHTLATILPSECAQPAPQKARRYDAALLFLVYPLEVVDDAMGQRIVDDVLTHLQGEHGIRRYLGDSYWTADYKDKVAPEERTADASQRQEERDALARPGEEAQWCIFDPIVSVIAGRRYLCTDSSADLEKQVHHLNRSLGQITGPDCPQGEFRCPEAYYLERGRYVPNDHVPLLWTEANLWLALSAMARSAAHKEHAQSVRIPTKPPARV
jgi:hypothetical protein